MQPTVAHGGSWHHHTLDAGASIRWAYEPYQKVFNVGFRIVVAPSLPGSAPAPLSGLHGMSG